MRRPLAIMLVAAVSLIAAACSSDSDEADVDTRALYYQEAAQLTDEYESAVGGHFDEYRAALESATEETGEEIFVTASQGLFAGLAVEVGAAVSGLSDLEPPEDLAEAHGQWVAAAEAFNTAIQATDDDIALLTDPETVNNVLSEVDLASLQEGYRAACRTVQTLATDADAVIVCQPPEAS